MWFILSLPFTVFSILVCAGLICIETLVHFKVESASVVSSTVCSFVDAERTDTGIKIKVKCNDKEYYSYDRSLLVWYVKNPSKEANCLITADGNIIKGE